MKLPLAPNHYLWIALCSACGSEPETRSELLYLSDGVSVEVHYESPSTDPQVPVLLLPGSFGPDFVPVIKEYTFEVGRGMVRIYLDLPGGEEEPFTTGTFDYYGTASRAAVASALRFASGEEADAEGRTLDEITGADLRDQLILAGRSNGGNLACAVLADPDLSLPPVAGLVTWETPSNPQFLLLEVVDPEMGTCTYTEGEGGLHCDMDYTLLQPDPLPYLDRNEDGVQGEDEPVFEGLDIDGVRYHSPTLLQHLEPSEGVSTEEESRAWFSWRNASQLASQAAALHPDLAVIVLGGEKDHAQAIETSPHVIGLGAAFTQAGLWTRLLPDTSYSGLVEQDAGEGFDLQDPGLLHPPMTWIMGLMGDAAMELADRHLNENWSADLSGLLVE